MHKSRTVKGLRLQQEHQERYERWWMGCEVNSSAVVNGIPAKGKVVKVEYVGNSVYGFVMITLDNGCELGVSGDGFRPKKGDINNC